MHPQTPPISSNFAPTTSVRNATYKLNRIKQVKKLGEDTTLGNFKIVVNSKNQNVTIECNSGFYSTVAVPAIKCLTVGRDKVVLGISIHCQDIVGNFDATQAQQNTVLFFRLNQDKNSLGSVRVHLHHTARKVQLQGGAVMPDKMTAPIWFVEHVLRKQFTQLAQAKSVDISEYNKSVNEMITKYLRHDKTAQVCAGCKMEFNGRSTPEQCSQCKLYYHKSKCLPSSNHACYTQTRAQSYSRMYNILPDGVSASSVSTLPTMTSVPRPAAPALGPSQQAQSTGSLGETFKPVETRPAPVLALTQAQAVLGIEDGQSVATDRDVNTNTSIGQGVELPRADFSRNNQHSSHDVLQQQPSISDLATDNPAVIGPYQGIATSTNLPYPQTLNPNAEPFIGEEQTQTTNKKNTGARKKTKQFPPSDPTSLEKEYTKYAMNTAKTKICEQETEIKELKFKNKILEDRLASLEKQVKQNVSDQYPSSLDPSQPTCGAPRWCCMPPPTRCCTHSHSGYSVDGARLDKITADIKRQSDQLTELTKKVESISGVVTSPTSGLPSQHSSTPHQQPNSDNNPDFIQSDAGEKDHNTSELSIDYVMMNVSQVDMPLN